MKFFILLCAFFTSCYSWAEDPNVIQSVLVNQAIVSTYTFNNDNILERHKTISHYFSTDGWINYLKALNNSKLLDTVKKNKLNVSSVALSPPTIQSISATQWKASMPLLVEYKNASVQKQQTLLVTITYKMSSDQNQLAIESFSSKQQNDLCTCGQSK